MNSSSLSVIVAGCEDFTLPKVPRHLPPSAHIWLVFIIVVNLLSFPFTILLNALVIIVVKTQRRLRSMANVLLACLSVTDLMVGLIIQPLRISTDIIALKGQTTSEFCILSKLKKKLFSTFWFASLLHLVLISGERYLAMKHSYTYPTLVNTARLLVASALSWIVAILPVLSKVFEPVLGICIVASVPIIIFFQGVVYGEVRRHEKQIIAHQVSLEAKEKFKKEKKALKITTTIIAAVTVCYVPSLVSKFVLVKLLDNATSATIEFQVLSVWTAVSIFNSLANPLIYTVRKQEFRVAFIQFLLRKTLQQAEEIEKRFFGSSRSQERQQRDRATQGRGNEELAEAVEMDIVAPHILIEGIILQNEDVEAEESCNIAISEAGQQGEESSLREIDDRKEQQSDGATQGQGNEGLAGDLEIDVVVPHIPSVGFLLQDEEAEVQESCNIELPEAEKQREESIPRENDDRKIVGFLLQNDEAEAQESCNIEISEAE